MFRSIRETARLIGTLAALASVGACGNVTAGGATGEVVVNLSGDANDPVPTAALLSAPTRPPATTAPMAAEDDTPEGEVEAEFTLFLETADGGLIALTDSAVRMRVDLEGVREPEVASQVISAGRYSALRMVFTEIEVEVDAGLIINGVLITGPIDVELEGTLVVTSPLTLDIGADEVVVLVIDLNSASWLQAVNPGPPATVDAQVLANLVTVSIR